jgi:UPF0716 protein FxsA
VVLLLGTAFFLVPLVEIVVIFEIGTRIGWDTTLTLLVLMSAAGAWMVKHEGAESWRRMQDGLHQGRMPTTDAVDALVVLLAGVLLLCPGFVTSFVGLLLFLPPVRRRASDLVAQAIRTRVSHHVRNVGSRMNGGFTVGDAARASRDAEGPPAGDGDGSRRAYRRPDEPFEEPTGPKVWGARVHTPSSDDGDVIDVDGEEMVFGQGELGPAGY